MYSIYMNLWPVTCSLFSFLLVFECFEWLLEKTYYFIGCFIHHVTLVLSFIVSYWKEILRLSWNLVISYIMPTTSPVPHLVLKISQCASTLVLAHIRRQFPRTCTLVVVCSLHSSHSGSSSLSYKQLSFIALQFLY